MKSQRLSSISPTDAVQLINRGAIVVDVRDKSKFDSGHIVDSRRIAKDELLAGAAEKFKKKKKAVLLICDSGSHSAQIAANLRKSGMEHVFSLKGGIAAWRQDNLPIVGDSGSA